MPAVLEFEYGGARVQIWRNALYGRYCWTLADSPSRCDDLGEYFESIEDCIRDAKETLNHWISLRASREDAT